MPRIPGEEVKWIEDQLMAVVDGQPARPTACERIGPIAVHPCVEEKLRDQWAVTSMTTGLRICRLPEKATAQKVALEVYNRYRKAFALSIREEILARVPKALDDWLKQCREAGKFLPHP